MQHIRNTSVSSGERIVLPLNDLGPAVMRLLEMAVREVGTTMSSGAERDACETLCSKIRSAQSQYTVEEISLLATCGDILLQVLAEDPDIKDNRATLGDAVFLYSAVSILNGIITKNMASDKTK